MFSPFQHADVWWICLYPTTCNDKVKMYVDIFCNLLKWESEPFSQRRPSVNHIYLRALGGEARSPLCCGEIWSAPLLSQLLVCVLLSGSKRWTSHGASRPWLGKSPQSLTGQRKREAPRWGLHSVCQLTAVFKTDSSKYHKHVCVIFLLCMMLYVTELSVHVFNSFFHLVTVCFVWMFQWNQK